MGDENRGGFERDHALWAFGSLCALHQKAFAPDLLAREMPVDADGRIESGVLLSMGESLGFRVKKVSYGERSLAKLQFPLLVELKEEGAHAYLLGLVTTVAAGRCVLFVPGQAEPHQLDIADLVSRATGTAWLFAPEVAAANDEDAAQAVTKAFGFRWFVPELLRHKKVWRDVLLASLALQIIALATPLFTQAIIDKVIVHRTQSTLITIGIAMGLFLVLSGLMSWARQYLVLHTGNRVDAVLGAAVWDHLLKLPLRYFEHRPTGVVAARLNAVETIREFVSGAAISLVLDLPFLLICLAVMLYYSVALTALAVGVLTVIAVASFIMAPIFQKQLNEQFLLGARNQAFVTEHIAGFETVKTLQMEPQLRHRYSGYLATLLASAFRTKQIANTYNTFSTTMEQFMTLGILVMGAYMVMNPEPGGAIFTVGMLVAFQMFTGKLSQPVLRIVGLWTQFQQASLSVQRLGDLMNVPVEPYSLVPLRQNDGPGEIEIFDMGFRYSDKHPLLYSHLNIKIRPGQTMAIMGPSGSGKSTLAKLLLGFYQPTEGGIRIDGIDLRNLSANELRNYFGVVPQETMLFSGSILANLQAGNPSATLDQVVRAARMAGIHEVIEQLPQGYQTEIGERGVGLSGGQKQRLAIARALLKRPKVLIFDEATSALDGETAESFAKTINQLKGKVTMLFITHAMPKTLKCDEVLHIGKGGVTLLGVNTPAASEADASRKGAH